MTAERDSPSADGGFGNNDGADWILESLRPHADRLKFRSGEVLRRQGHHYSDTLLLLSGTAIVELESRDGETRSVGISPGQPVGEIGFLSGRPASGTVTARSDGEAIIVDDGTLDRIEAVSSETAARLLRFMARTADERLERDSSYNFSDLPIEDADRIEVKLCRTPELLFQAQALRYEVYCNELKRSSPYADETKKIIADSLDVFGHTFVALDGETAIGSIRLNFPHEGDLGLYTDLYGLRNSEHFPDKLGICTKFVIRREFRGGPLAMKLIAASTRYGMRFGARECYIDTIPSLSPFYRAMGFEACAESFVHRENGTSIPMRVDLDRRGERLCRDPSKARLAALYLKAKSLGEKAVSGADPD